MCGFGKTLVTKNAFRWMMPRDPVDLVLMVRPYLQAAVSLTMGFYHPETVLCCLGEEESATRRKPYDRYNLSASSPRA